MTKKTERLYASANLDGTDAATTASSFALAVANLANEASKQGREALFDTLDVKIERATIEELSLFATNGVLATITTITVSAEAIKVSETTTEKKDR